MKYLKDLREIALEIRFLNDKRIAISKTRESLRNEMEDLTNKCEKLYEVEQELLQKIKQSVLEEE